MAGVKRRTLRSWIEHGVIRLGLLLLGAWLAMLFHGTVASWMGDPDLAFPYWGAVLGVAFWAIAIGTVEWLWRWWRSRKQVSR